MFGQVVKGIFKAMLKVRERMKTKFSELAPYQKRYELAGQYLTKLLHAGIQRGEEMTAIATCLSAGEHVCIDHKDLNNCSMAAYSHHGMLCLSVRDSRGLIWLLQVGLYFKKYVGHFIQPYNDHLKGILENMESYLNKLRVAYFVVLKKSNVSAFDEWGVNTFDKEDMYFSDDF